VKEEMQRRWDAFKNRRIYTDLDPATLAGIEDAQQLDVFGDLDQAIYALDGVEGGSRRRIEFIRAHPEQLAAG
jgi:hypothetical protein